MSDEKSMFDEIEAGPERVARVVPEEKGGLHWHMCYYRCPRGLHGVCGVQVSAPAGGSLPGRWEWDGNESAPTLSPSILCHECGWHGFVRAGKLVDA